jgi:NADPH:quinone reductase-like Zn-dependent oxidoreductase
LGVEAAAASAVSGLTAWHLVLTRGSLQAAENLAIFGATGAVGSFAVQLGRLAGARIIAVTRHGDREAQLRQLGADVVIVEGEGEVAQRVNDATDGAGADLVVDPLGQSTWAWSFASVARNGRWTTCGALTWADVGLNLASLYSREVELIGSTGGNRAELRELLGTVARHQLKVPVWRKFPLGDAAEALDSLEKAERLGKVLIKLVPGGRA